MKIRITSNNLRFRLGRNEVQTLGNGGKIDETIRIGNSEMNFILFADKQAKAKIEDQTLMVSVSSEQARQWALNDQVGIETTVDGLSITIEKDFKCLHGPTENQAECFPNPLEQATR